MITLPKYITIEVKEFPLKVCYSGNPFSEFKEFEIATENREKEIYNYYKNKLGEDYLTLPFPSRTNVSTGDGKRTYYHISQAHYAANYSQRVLVSMHDESHEVTAIFQIAKSKNAE